MLKRLVAVGLFVLCLVLIGAITSAAVGRPPLSDLEEHRQVEDFWQHRMTDASGQIDRAGFVRAAQQDLTIPRGIPTRNYGLPGKNQTSP